MIIKKKYTREFPLLLCEMWGEAYTEIFGIKIKCFPRYMFIVKDGLVSNYRNEEIVKEINQIFLDKLEKDEDFLKKFYKDYMNKFQELEKMWRKGYLAKEELVELYKKMVVFWNAIYASMYIPEDNKFSKDDQKLMLSFRKEIDVAADEATHIINNSLKHHYPELGHLTNYVKLADLKKDKIDTKSLKQLSEEELIMVDNKFVSKSEFENIKKKYDFELEKIEVEKEVKELQGQTACKGHAKGKVRMVMKRSDVETLQQGEILVSSMTVPDFLPAMEKASAFVTDEGGITCHAAIVAREMNKPCIIGTKVATSVLKNGDLVSVNANKGVVRRIK